MDLEFGAQLARLKVKQDWFLVIEGPQITRILHGMPAANGLLLFLLEASDHSCRISFMRQFKHSQTMLRFCVAYCHNAVGFEEQQVSSAQDLHKSQGGFCAPEATLEFACEDM